MRINLIAMLLPEGQLMRFAASQIKLSPLLAKLHWYLVPPEDIASEDVDVCCEESEVGIHMPGVVSCSAARETVSDQPVTEDMDVCEEFDGVVDVPCCRSFCRVPESTSDETTTNMDVCKKPESDGGLPVVAYFDPLLTGLGKECVSSGPTLCPWILNRNLLCYCQRLDSRTRGTGYLNSGWIRGRYERRR